MKANAKEVEKILAGRIDLLAETLVYKSVQKATKDTQSAFNRFEEQASTDYPQVTVTCSLPTKTNGVYEGQVICQGNQVIFLEFGVGVSNRFIPTNDGNDKPARGFNFQTGREEAPRPAGVVGLGQYGKGHGKQEYWVRPSATGIPKTNIGEQEVHKRDRDGNIIGVRTDVVWTRGHPPARALWYATQNAINQTIEKYKNQKAIKFKNGQGSLFD